LRHLATTSLFPDGEPSWRKGRASEHPGPFSVSTLRVPGHAENGKEGAIMFRQKIHVVVLPLLLCGAPSFAADKPVMPPEVQRRPPIMTSFDCAKLKPRERALRMVCADPDLAALDVQEDQLLRRARARAVHPAAVDADQDVWRSQRDSCSSPGCVARAYRRRMQELHDWTN
jgi:hypothetical protein